MSWPAGFGGEFHGLNDLRTYAFLKRIIGMATGAAGEYRGNDVASATR